MTIGIDNENLKCNEKVKEIEDLPEIFLDVKSSLDELKLEEGEKTSDLIK